MKRTLGAILAGIVLGLAPAGASSFAVSAHPTLEVFPKVDGYKDSTFIEFSTGTRCVKSSRLGIVNVNTGERVFLLRETSSRDECTVGLGHRWYGRYGAYGEGRHVPYGKYRARARVVLWSGKVLTDSLVVYVRRG